MKKTALADILNFAGVPERIANPKHEKFVTVRLNGRGAVQRPIKDGKVPVAFTGYRLRAGQLVYSRIDARNGAFALVPASLAGAVVSKDFPVFDVRQDRVDSRYLLHYFQSGRLQREIQAKSFGATNRQRLSEDGFLSFNIPLPSTERQRHIADILDSWSVLRELRLGTLAATQKLKQATITDFVGRMGGRKSKLADLVDNDDRINYGVVQPGSTVVGGVPLVRVSDLKFGRIDRTALKTIAPDVEASYSRSRLRGNEVLVVCVGGTIGHIAHAEDVDIGSNIARAVARVPISDVQLRKFVEAYLETDCVQRYFKSELRTVAQPTLNIKQLGETLIPLPPREELAHIHRTLDVLERLVAEARASLLATDQLGVSLRAQAFSGQL